MYICFILPHVCRQYRLMCPWTNDASAVMAKWMIANTHLFMNWCKWVTINVLHIMATIMVWMREKDKMLIVLPLKLLLTIWVKTFSFSFMKFHSHSPTNECQFSNHIPIYHLSYNKLTHVYLFHQ